LFEAIADQRLTLSTLLLLSPFVGAVPVEELISGLAHKSHTASREWLAARFPRSALPTRTEFVSADGSRTLVEPGTTSGVNEGDAVGQLATSRVALSETGGSANLKGPLPSARTIPLSAELVAYQFTVERATHELLLRAQELLGSEVAPGDLAKVFALALKSLVREREKSRHGLHTESRGTSAALARGRYIPAQLKAQVYKRDQGQCAFTTDDGLRCECRADLEYDHIVPLAQGGRTTADNLRLLCAAHNQYEADRKLGRAFMEQKRANTLPLVNHERKHDDFEGVADVQAALRTLGYRKEEIATAMAFAAGLPDALTPPERVKAILRQRHVHTTGHVTPTATP
jgi:5-methylcytosine-specific restriction endonuclease McrA